LSHIIFELEPKEGLFYGGGFFGRGLVDEVVGLGGGLKLPLLKGGPLVKGTFSGSFLGDLDFFCYSTH